LGNVRHQVIVDALQVFADKTALMGAYGIKVAQARDAPAGLRVREVGEDVFYEEFGAAIRVGRGAREIS
jgi:hypothetical protein